MYVLRVLLFLAICVSSSGYAKSAFTLDYPKARRGGQTDTFHGVVVTDPFRWMEDTESAETRAWIETENNLTFSYLATIPQREQIKKRLTELWNYERFFTPEKVGKIYIYARNDGLQNQNVLYKTSSLTGKSEVFFDPNKLSNDGTVALSDGRFSDDGTLWAYGVAVAGSDRSEWRVMDVATGKILDDHLAPNRQGNISWLKDKSGFFYSRFPETAKGGELKETTQFEKIYFHKLGTPQSDDKLIYERPDNGEYGVSGEVSEDGKWLIVAIAKGTERMNMVYFKDLSKKEGIVEPLVTDLKSSYVFIGNDGPVFYFHTDKDAARGKIAKIDVSRADRNWTDVIPEAQNALEEVHFIGNQFVALYLKDAVSQVQFFTTKGKLLRSLSLPGLGSVDGFTGKRKDFETFYRFSSFNVPPTVYRYDLKTGKSSVFKESKVKFDPKAYEVEQVFFTSKDGTRVPMFITHKKGIKLDGNNKTLLYGYGGFTYALTPSFSASRIAWMEMGGVYAVANIRGGSEYGKAWWEGGSRLKKQNVFDDFIAAGEWLISHKYTSTPKLAIEGGSNGGLLVGAVLNQRPDLFGVAIPRVGVMDMLRFDKFTIGFAWKSDYGSPDDPTDFKAMYAYSPYHNVKKGTRYPATLITTADHDDRVFPAHSFKYAAALQDAQSGPSPILIRIETKAGHGAGKSTTKIIEETADVYAFIMKNLGT